MYNAIALFALILSVACAVLIQHVLVRFNRVENGFKEWSVEITNECNSNIQNQYNLIMKAVRSDVESIVNEKFPPEDLSDVEQYIEDAEVVLG